jgi:hypothetical protein
MGGKPRLLCQAGNRAVRGGAACLVAAAVVMSTMAMAQERVKPPEERGFFEGIANWFEETFSGAGRQVENFGNEAGIAAKTTVNTAKDAAGAVARIPAARVMSGHAKCVNAPNGAPDCRAAANALCKDKGFESGKSLDMTAAEVCPAKVLLSGRTGAPGECKDETFVSRALCQ